MWQFIGWLCLTLLLTGLVTTCGYRTKDAWDKWHKQNTPQLTNKQQPDPSTGDTKIDQKGDGNVAVGKIEHSNVTFKITKEDSIIRSIEFRVNLDFYAKEGTVIKKGASAGLSSVIALFSHDKIRYRFITDYQFSESKLDSNRGRVSFTYKPENPEQILGKEIKFLETITTLVINYSEFIKITHLEIDKNKPMTFNWDMYLNGVRVISQSSTVVADTICNGQTSMGVSTYFSNIDEIYPRIVSTK